MPKAILKIYRQLKQDQTNVVHCHLFDACIAGLTAAKLAGVRKRIYTRHHATFHYEYFPRAVYYDKFINYLATDVVAISENVRQVLLQEGVKPNKIHLIHHGFRLEEFMNVPLERVSDLRKKYGLCDQHPVIGLISRYFELKGIQYVIPAFRQLLQHYPSAKLVLANATGNYGGEIRQLLSGLPESSYVEIPFEPDIGALYQLFDVFVHVPINPQIEAFGQTYVEALAAGIPSAFTLSGVAPEFIEHRKNAWVVPFRDSAAVFAACRSIIQNRDLVATMVVQGRKDVTERFALSKMIRSLETLYER